MKKVKFFGLTMLTWIVLGSQTLAMCIWFLPPGRTFEPAQNIKTLVHQDGSNQTIVVQPQFQGSATDFALLMPFPSQPEVAEAPKKIFTQLENLTNPVQEFDDVVPLSAEAGTDLSRADEVVVVEQRDVGDFEATTITADNNQALKDWLEDNNYEIDEKKIEILDQYINEETNFFVALKINMSEADVDRNGILSGELNPIQFTFNSNNVMLPLRLMADVDSKIFDLVIYTLSKDQLYVPGAEIQFARKVTASDVDNFKSLAKYEAQSKWLTRNSLSLNTSKIEKDMSFYETPADVVVEVGDESFRVNPDLLDPKTGLREAEGGTIKYVDEDSNQLRESALSDEDTRPLIVITILLGVANLFLINTVLKLRSDRDKNESAKWN